VSDDLRDLIADLAGAGNDARVLDVVEPVVKRGAVNIKKDWRAKAAAAAPAHARQYPYSIDFDTARSTLAHSVGAVIGPDKDKPQGALGNLLEFGSVNNPPQLSGQQALDAEADAFEQQVAKAERRLTW
jgi:hypothetical protein